MEGVNVGLGVKQNLEWVCDANSELGGDSVGIQAMPAGLRLGVALTWVREVVHGAR